MAGESGKSTDGAGVGEPLTRDELNLLLHVFVAQVLACGDAIVDGLRPSLARYPLETEPHMRAAAAQLELRGLAYTAANRGADATDYPEVVYLTAAGWLWGMFVCGDALFGASSSSRWPHALDPEGAAQLDALVTGVVARAREEAAARPRSRGLREQLDAR